MAPTRSPSAKARPAAASRRRPPASASHAVVQPAAAAAAADEAFASGDFLRARGLLRALLTGTDNVPAAMRQRLGRRLLALGLDGYVVRVGLGTAVLYGAAWIYALAQH